MIAYFVLVICGTMGSPNPVKLNKVDCGVHNNCALVHQQEFDPTKYEMWW